MARASLNGGFFAFGMSERPQQVVALHSIPKEASAMLTKGRDGIEGTIESKCRQAVCWVSQEATLEVRFGEASQLRMPDKKIS